MYHFLSNYVSLLLYCKPQNTSKIPYLFRVNKLTNGNHMEWKPMNSKEDCDEEEDLSSLFTSFDGHLSIVCSSKWCSRLSPFIYDANDLSVSYQNHRSRNYVLKEKKN